MPQEEGGEEEDKEEWEEKEAEEDEEGNESESENEDEDEDKVEWGMEDEMEDSTPIVAQSLDHPPIRMKPSWASAANIESCQKELQVSLTSPQAEVDHKLHAWVTARHDEGWPAAEVYVLLQWQREASTEDPLVVSLENIMDVVAGYCPSSRLLWEGSITDESIAAAMQYFTEQKINVGARAQEVEAVDVEEQL